MQHYCSETEAPMQRHTSAGHPQSDNPCGTPSAENIGSVVQREQHLAPLSVARNTMN